MATVVMELPDVLDRIRGEYREMPGLNLTRAQAQRLWSLDSCMCERVLRELVDTHFLRQTPKGTFVRFDGGSPPATSRNV